MPIKLEDLLYLQHHRCFFCDKELTRGEASIEHLLPVSKNGPNHQDNCVACCKKLNAVFADMSLKEKIRFLLRRDGPLQCPSIQMKTEGGRGRPARVEHLETESKVPNFDNSSKAKPLTVAPAEPPTLLTNLQILRDHLIGLKAARPKKIATLTRAANARFQNRLPDSEIQNLILQLQSEGLYTIAGDAIKYSPTFGK